MKIDDGINVSRQTCGTHRIRHPEPDHKVRWVHVTKPQRQVNCGQGDAREGNELQRITDPIEREAEEWGRYRTDSVRNRDVERRGFLGIDQKKERTYQSRC